MYTSQRWTPLVVHWVRVRLPEQVARARPVSGEIPRAEGQSPRAPATEPERLETPARRETQAPQPEKTHAQPRRLSTVSK